MKAIEFEKFYNKLHKYSWNCLNSHLFQRVTCRYCQLPVAPLWFTYSFDYCIKVSAQLRQGQSFCIHNWSLLAKAMWVDDQINYLQERLRPRFIVASSYTQYLPVECHQTLYKPSPRDGINQWYHHCVTKLAQNGGKPYGFITSVADLRFDNMTARSQQTIIIRLRTGHNRLRQHMYKRFKVGDSEICPCGQASQNTEHVLQTCSSHKQLRARTWPNHTPLEKKLYGTTEELAWQWTTLWHRVSLSDRQLQEERRRRRRRIWQVD